MDPLTVSSGIVSVANGAFTLATNFWKLNNVDDDLKICLKLLLMMTDDANGARRLRSSRYPQHHSQTATPNSLLDRTNRAITDLELAMKEICKSIEGVRVEKSADNSISIAKRFVWVYKGKNNFNAQQWLAHTAHARVLSVITSMESLPHMQVEMSDAPPAYEEAILRSPSQMRALKGKSTAVVVTEREKFTGMSLRIALLYEGLLKIFIIDQSVES